MKYYMRTCVRYYTYYIHYHVPVHQELRAVDPGRGGAPVEEAPVQEGHDRSRLLGVGGGSARREGGAEHVDGQAILIAGHRPVAGGTDLMVRTGSTSILVGGGRRRV